MLFILYYSYIHAISDSQHNNISCVKVTSNPINCFSRFDNNMFYIKTKSNTVKGQISAYFYNFLSKSFLSIRLRLKINLHKRASSYAYKSDQNEFILIGDWLTRRAKHQFLGSHFLKRTVDSNFYFHVSGYKLLYQVNVQFLQYL